MMSPKGYNINILYERLKRICSIEVRGHLKDDADNFYNQLFMIV